MVDFDAAFGEQLLDVAVGEPEAQVPADRQDDHVWWEAEAGEGSVGNASRTRAASAHGQSLPTPQQSPQMQQRACGHAATRSAT
jgi:hypothetical protein